jgi:hypothetical protein
MRDGLWLTENELKYLSLTSEMNRFLDKEFYQKAVNLCDPEIQNNIEMNIAESIVKNYNQIREIILKARRVFLKSENLKSRALNQEFLKRVEEENERLANMQKIRKMLESNKQSAQRRLQKIENEYKAKEKNNKNLFVYKMKRRLRSIQRDIKEEETEGAHRRKDHDKEMLKELNKMKEDRKQRFYDRNYLTMINTNF